MSCLFVTPAALIPYVVDNSTMWWDNEATIGKTLKNICLLLTDKVIA